MATKIHCDLCDAVGAGNAGIRTANTRAIDLPRVRFERMTVAVYVTRDMEPNPDSTDRLPVPGLRSLEVCDDCRVKLVADAFSLRTYGEYNALRDQLTDCMRNKQEQP